MRLRILAALALVCAASLTPSAAAAPSSLSLGAPETTPANSTVGVNVTLSLSGFLCHEPHTVTVTLAASTTDGVKATFPRTTLTFEIPARSYFAESYAETQTANLTVRAISAGAVDVTARFAADVGPCFVPGGFDPAEATAQVAVQAPARPAPPTDGAAPVTNETNATPVEGNATVPTPATPAPPRNGSRPSCAPDGGCGLIGEYEAPAESADRDTPGVTPLLAAGILALAAFVARRRKA